MAGLKLSHIYKVYDNGKKAVNDFSIDIKDKEFIVFVGPSGCGKSTTLRMIAGLETITAGDLFIGDTLVNDVEPKDRDIAMVFQSYALYPHMTVYENMAFGLRNQHILSEKEIKEKVENAARILDIEKYLNSKPKEMSGGERQRVALGRALVRDPKVFLLDEPLSNLDAKLRAQMRTEITKLHKSLATTFIYVTHDQVEAMTMGTRIVVMKLGYVQQIDTPMNLYNEPYNKFVAGFIGSPQMNFFNVLLKRINDKVDVLFDDGSIITLPYERLSRIHDSYLNGEKAVTLGIRPEHIMITNEDGLKCCITAVEHLGNECIVYAKLGDHEEEFTLKEIGNDVVFKVIEGTEIDVGDIVRIAPLVDKVHFFDKNTEVTLMKRIPEYSSVEVKVSGNMMNIFNKSVVLPEVFAKSLGVVTEFTMEISPFNIIPGNDFKLKVHKIEKVNDQYLAYLSNNDKYLFAIVDETVKEDDEYCFSIINEKVRLLVDGKELLAPISDNIEILGTFEKEEVKEKKERIYHFYYRIGDFVIEAPLENGYKINSIDGNACYRNTYKYSINRNKVRLVEENGIKGSVEEILRYSNATFAKVRVADSEILINVDDRFNQNEVNICFDSKDVEVFSTKIDMKIC